MDWNARGGKTIRRLTILVGLGMVVVDVAGVHILLATLDVPDAVPLAGAALTAVVVGGSFALVVGSRIGGAGSAPADDPSMLVRVARVVVSVTVLSGVTVVLGVGGGIVLTLLAALGGPDPKTEDGAPLRRRLLGWVGRNQDFMQTSGHDEPPLTP